MKISSFLILLYFVLQVFSGMVHLNSLKNFSLSILSLAGTLTSDENIVITPNSLTLNVTFTESGTVWGIALSSGSEVPSSETIKESSFYVEVMENEPALLTLSSLESNVSYDIYLFAENSENDAMETTIESTLRQATTARMPSPSLFIR